MMRREPNKHYAEARGLDAVVNHSVRSSRKEKGKKRDFPKSESESDNIWLCWCDLIVVVM
jgi:hypothetical protein